MAGSFSSSLTHPSKWLGKRCSNCMQRGEMNAIHDDALLYKQSQGEPANGMVGILQRSLQKTLCLDSS
jgi:hypothetical protein